jgi:ABC-2 type transport system permease protein
MTTTADTLAEAAPPAPPAAMSATRPFYWSLRRELWENRSVYFAPLIVAGVVLFGFTLSAAHPPHFTGMHVDRAGRAFIYLMPYLFAAVAVIGAAFIVAVFYCLGALHNERRDRSILFWKSLPVSDLTIVLAKAAVPFVVIPAVVFGVVVVLQIVMLLLNSGFLLAQGRDPALLWAQLPLPRIWLILLYGLITSALWYAPLYGWLLLVSGWARRAPFLWAVLPPLGLCVVEKFAFDTGWFAHVLGDRLGGGVNVAFASPPPGAPGLPMPQFDPAGFAASPGLWLGLVVGAVFLAAAVRLRRTREPV